MSATYLGIDPSYSGYAVVAYTEHAGEPGVSHTEWESDFTWGAGSAIDRLCFAYDVLTAEFARYHLRGDVVRVCLEGYAYGARFQREALGELGGVTRLALARTIGAERVTIVPPTALKKFVSGKGQAPKDVMLLKTHLKWGVEFDSNNLADAYGLARIAEALETGGRHAYEREVLDALTAAPTPKKKRA